MANQNTGRVVINNGSKSKKTAKKVSSVRRLGEDKPKRTVCPIDVNHFEEHATPLALTFDGETFEVIDIRSGEEVPFELEPVVFKTGTMGYTLNGKTTFNIGGEDVPVTINFNVYLTGSKPKE